MRGERPALEQLPPEVLAISGARVADFGNNALEALPAALGGLAALQRLRLSWNWLSAGSFPGTALAPLQQLVVLALDHNRRALSADAELAFSWPNFQLHRTQKLSCRCHEERTGRKRIGQHSCPPDGSCTI